MRIYLAGRYGRIDELNGYARALRKMGHTVDCRWLSGAHRAEDAQLTEELSEHIATQDLVDIGLSDVLIAFTDPPRSTSSRGGRHVEFGYALAYGISCYRVGPIENVFYTRVTGYPTWSEFLRRGQPERWGQ